MLMFVMHCLGMLTMRDAKKPTSSRCMTQCLVEIVGRGSIPSHHHLISSCTQGAVDGRWTCTARCCALPAGTEHTTVTVEHVGAGQSAATCPDDYTVFS